jgi:hypothetical protein
MDLALIQLNNVEAAELLPSLAQARGYFSQMPNPSFHSKPIPQMPNPTFPCKTKKSKTGNLRCKVESRNHIFIYCMHIRVQINLRALKHFWLQSLRIVILWSKPFKTNNGDGYKNADLTLIFTWCNVSTVGFNSKQFRQENFIILKVEKLVGFFIFK